MPPPTEHPEEAREPVAEGATCVRDGRQWRITLGRQGVQIAHSVGMLHLAVLLNNPGRDIPAVELVMGTVAFGKSADQSVPDNQERARLAVTKAIRRAIARVSEADAVIGEHLKRTVHTGVRCSYLPD